MIALIVVLSQFILYGSLSLLMGTFILKLVPAEFRPSFHIPTKGLIWSAVAIPVVAFVPNVQLLKILVPQFGFFDSIWTIVSKYKVGHAWLVIVLLALILLLFIRFEANKAGKLLIVCAIVLLIAIMAAIGYVSHAGSMVGIAGSVYDFIHLLAVSVWLGILIIISFFTTNSTNWEAFLKWFSPTALVSFTAVALSGVLMTEAIVPAYVTGWASDYGHFLFIKHVLLLPLTFIILANGLLIKLKIQKPLFEPRTWVKIETGLLIGILFMTALFSEHQPPAFAVQDISSVFQLFYSGSVETGMHAYFQMTGIGIMFFLLTVLFIGLMVVSYLKELPNIISIAMATAMALCFYMGFMSIVFFE